MAISFVGATSTLTPSVPTSTATTATASVPTGLQVNDLIIIAVHRQQDYVIGTTPAGYTWLENILDQGTSPSAANTDIYYRFSDGTETTGPTFTTATATKWICQTAVYRGVSTSSPFIDHGGAITPGTTANRVGPALTNTDANAWGVFATCIRGLATPVSFTPPTGLTERLDNDFGQASTANVAAEWADTAGVVGSTGSITYTAVSSGSIAVANAWAAFLTVGSAGTPTDVGALTAAGVGSATIANPVVSQGLLLVAAGVGSVVFDIRTGGGTGSFAVAPFAISPFGGSGAAPLVTKIAVATAAGTGAASLIGIVSRAGALTATGTGAATASGLQARSGLEIAAGVGTASVFGGQTILVAPPHVAVQATIISNGISDATLLALSPGVATIATVTPSDAEVLSPGLAAATVLAVPPGVATVQIT